MTKRPDQLVYKFEDFRLDAASAMLYNNGKEVALPPKAVETLLALVERSGEIVPKAALMEIIWADSIVEESNLSQYLHLLRKTLGKTKAGDPFIETLKRRGYRFNGDVSLSEATNGFSPRMSGDAERIKDPVPVDGREANSHIQSFRRIERHGNVLAVADWQESEKDVLPVENPRARSEKALSQRVQITGPAFIATAVLAILSLGAFLASWFFGAPDAKTSAVKEEQTIVNLTSGEDVDFATISPNGTYFVYASPDGDRSRLWLQQTGQATRREIIEPIAGTIFGTTFTPDSQSIYFLIDVKGQYTLYRVPALGGVHTKLIADVASPVSFSPDGKRMVFRRLDPKTGRERLIISSSDGEGQTDLLPQPDEPDTIRALNPAWSPDGKSVAFSYSRMDRPEGSCTINSVDLNSRTVKALSSETWDGCFRMAWTRDSQGLVFIGTRFKESFSTRRDQVYYLSVSDGQSRRLTTAGGRYQYASLGLTDENEVFAVQFNRLSQIWSMDASGSAGTAAQISKGQTDGRGGIAPVADGLVAYLTRSGDGFSTWVMNADGSNNRQLTTSPAAIEELRAPPDGRYFIFSAKVDGWSHLYRVDATGADLKQLTSGNSNEVDSSVSPDGNWIIFHSKSFEGNSDEGALWRIPSGGGESVRLTDADCETPHFSPDGKSISCVSIALKRISIVSAEDGTTLRTFDAVENSFLNIGARWTPDGKSLTYIVARNNVGNLWLQPIENEAPRPLTDFSSGDIYNFAFSADGSRLYTARGYGTRNAVLIRNIR